MELLTGPAPVLLARVCLPIIVHHYRIYCVYLDLPDTPRFVSASRPIVLDLSGEPLTLAAEIPIGSIIRVHAVNGALRTVQIVQRKVVNPFAAQPVGQLAATG